MSNPFKRVEVWYCLTLTLAVAFGSIGSAELADYALNGLSPSGRMNMHPAGCLMGILTCATVITLLLQKKTALLVLATSVLALALVFALAPTGWQSSAFPSAPSLNLSLFAVSLIVISALAAAILSWGWLIGLIAAPLVSGLGVLSLLSHWHEPLATFTLGASTESNLLTSPLLIIAGFTTPSFHFLFRSQLSLHFRGLFVLSLIGVSAATLGWHTLRLEHSENLVEKAALLAEEIQEASVSSANTRLKLIQRLTERWEAREVVVTDAVYDTESMGYFRDFPELKFLGVLNGDFEPIHTASNPFDPFASNRLWLESTAFRRSLQRASERESLRLSRPLQTVDGSTLTLVSVPMNGLEQPDLSVLAVFDFPQLLGYSTEEHEHTFDFRIFYKDNLVFDTAHVPPETPKLELTARTSDDNSWRVEIYAHEPSLPADELYLPPTSLFFGLAVCFLLLLSYVFYRQAEERAQSQSELNSRLTDLLDSEKKLRIANAQIMEFSRDLLCSMSSDGTFLTANPASELILGYAPEELTRQHYSDLLLPEDIELTESQFKKLISGEISVSRGFRTRLKHKNGRIVCISWTAEWSEADQTLFGIGRDITDRLEAERLAKEREQFFSLSPDPFFIIARDGTLFEVNQMCIETFGFSRAELIGKNCWDLLHPDDRAKTSSALDSLYQDSYPLSLTVRAVSAKGGDRWLQLNAILSSDGLFYVAARDITEQRIFEERLLESEALLRMAERVALLGGWTLDLKSHEFIWSEAVRDVFELEPDQMLTLPDLDWFLIPREQERLKMAIAACGNDGTPFDEVFQTCTTKQRPLWVRVIGRPVRDENEQIVKVQGACQDITESRNASNQIRLLAERRATIFESITDAVFTLDHSWRFTYVNGKSEELLQKKRNELLGRSIWALFPEAIGSEFEVQYRRALETGKSVSFESYYAPLNNWVEVSAYPSEEGLAVYYRRINDRKEAEKRLELAMAELERSNRELEDFAFVASHDLQEPLRKIQAFSDRLMTKVDQLSDRDRDYLSRMHQAAARMQRLITDLLKYSRIATRAQPMLHCDSNSILAEVLQDLETAIAREDASIEVSDLPPIKGDPTQIRQVLQNLLSNAIKFHEADKRPQVRVFPENMNSTGWTLVVEDEGIGFDTSYADKLFHPFQRLHGRADFAGTGIGMAIVKKILDRHDASIRVDSCPGEGTSFRIRFANAMNKDERSHA